MFTLDEKKEKQFLDWYLETYNEVLEKWEDGKYKIITIYSNCPDATEKAHKTMWREKIKEMLWPIRSKRIYTHRWGREETWLDLTTNGLWFNVWPVFRHINEHDVE